MNGASYNYKDKDNEYLLARRNLSCNTYQLDSLEPNPVVVKSIVQSAVE